MKRDPDLETKLAADTVAPEEADAARQAPTIPTHSIRAWTAGAIQPVKPPRRRWMFFRRSPAGSSDLERMA